MDKELNFSEIKEIYPSISLLTPSFIRCLAEIINDGVQLLSEQVLVFLVLATECKKYELAHEIDILRFVGVLIDDYKEYLNNCRLLSIAEFRYFTVNDLPVWWDSINDIFVADVVAPNISITINSKYIFEHILKNLEKNDDERIPVN